MNGISTHILDIALGKPATSIMVILDRKAANDTWQRISSERTDDDGRCKQVLTANTPLLPGEYRLHFETRPYHHAQGVVSLYPFVEVTFLVSEGDSHIHIPLLLSPNGYTTYRGT